MLAFSDANPYALGFLALCWAFLGGVVVMAFYAPRHSGDAWRRDGRSLLGYLLQVAAFGIAFTGPYDIVPLSQAALRDALPTLVLAGASVGLFTWAAAALGANWSLLARTRDHHQLVQTGPFAYVRHPHYVALFGLLTATALGWGHAPGLLAAIPLYVVGTAQRVAVEERLLRTMFAEKYKKYARKVRRFVPGVF
jgi:Phospholipid methyltransferase